MSASGPPHDVTSTWDLRVIGTNLNTCKMAYAYNGAPMTANGIKPMSFNTASIGRKLNNMMMMKCEIEDESSNKL